MSNLSFMPDSRRDQLVKAAEECIDLINLGVEPNAALRQVKTAACMNDKEVILVSHAVNNAQVLSHLQSSKGDERGKPFPLTNADEVVGADHKGDKDVESETAAKAEDQPDALEIAKDITKTAYAASYYEQTNYRTKTPQQVDELRAAWGLEKTSGERETVDLSNPYWVLNDLKLAADSARERALEHREAAYGAMQGLIDVFSKVASPNWGEFEAAALRNGVQPATLDLVYEQGDLETLGVSREQFKVAGEVMYTSQEILNLVKQAAAIEEHIEASANAMTAENLLAAQIHAGEVKLAALPKAVFDVGSLMSSADESAKSLSTLGESTMKGLGIGEDSDGAYLGLAGKELRGEGKETPKIDLNVRQRLKNFDVRSTVEELMADEFIGKHALPDVVSAYNEAVSVNPRFGKAELTAYIRQHLANRGAMPLDLLVKATKAHQGVVGATEED